jgi:hypothetical protein
MAREPVFFSFYFDDDVFRVQQVRNMGVIDDNEPVSPNEWETVKRRGDAAIERWIDENMKYKRCIIVLIGARTSNRPWVQYEIRRAWELGKALLGVHIHNLRCPRNGTCSKGVNPFDNFEIGSYGQRMSAFVPCYDPQFSDAYGEISRNLQNWVATAIQQVRLRP